MDTTISVERAMPAKYQWQGAKLVPALVVGSLGCLLWFIPTPSGLSQQTWHLFAIFLATIVGLIVKPLPMGAVAILAVAAATLTNTLTIKQGLSSFSSHIVWLIVSAFLLARGFIKTGLGSRIAYYFIALLGKSTLGLAYGLVATELLLAPFMPSNTARGAGIIYPIIASLNKEYNSSFEHGTHKKIGSYLIKLLFQVNVITSAMFMTGTAVNPLIAGIAIENGINLSWTTWAVACIVPGVINLICLPLLVYYLYPPELKQTPNAPIFAKDKLKSLGALSIAEMIMLGTFALLLLLWVFGSKFGVNATTAALVGLSILLFTGVLKWEDVIKEHNAWDTFMWMAVLIMLSNQLAALGMMTWISQGLQSLIHGVPWLPALLAIVVFYCYSHYMFASMTAHASALFGTLLIVAMATGAPPMVAVLLLAAVSSLCAGITHYGTGSAPVFFGASYVTVRDWWRVGGLVSIFNLMIWLLVGFVWWKVLGFW